MNNNKQIEKLQGILERYQILNPSLASDASDDLLEELENLFYEQPTPSKEQKLVKKVWNEHERAIEQVQDIELTELLKKGITLMVDTLLLQKLNRAPTDEEKELAKFFFWTGHAANTVNKELLKAANNLIKNWEDRMSGDKEELKHNKDAGYYFSPSASMVSSEFIAALRTEIKKAEQLNQ